MKHSHKVVALLALLSGIEKTVGLLSAEEKNPKEQELWSLMYGSVNTTEVKTACLEGIFVFQTAFNVLLKSGLDEQTLFINFRPPMAHPPENVDWTAKYTISRYQVGCFFCSGNDSINTTIPIEKGNILSSFDHITSRVTLTDPKCAELNMQEDEIIEDLSNSTMPWAGKNL